MRGLGVDEFHRLTLFVSGAALLGRGKDTDVAQGKVTIARAAWPVAFHGFIGQGLDADCVEAPCLHLGGDYPAVIGRVLASHDKGAIPLFGEGCTIETLGRQVVQNHPVEFFCRILGRILCPRSKALGQFLIFKLCQSSGQWLVRLFPFHHFITAIGRVNLQINLAADGGGEGCDEPVIVAHGQRIVGMVMAAGTADGQPQHAGAHGVGHVVEFIVASRLKLLFGQLCWEHARAQKTGGHHRQRFIRGKFIACQLPAHELVVGHAGVERLDDKVAVMVGVFAVVILLKAVALGKARHVQPVPCPALAIMRTGQKPIDHLFQCSLPVTRSGLNKGVHLLGCGRQANEIKIKPAQ